ncbi:hypothetical protein CORC01_12335 [Colletotrichum orchidophilum]|uniref:Uncharacterized protein n=1 Tax=Colletotrichum orchidophilum TaxID=1209926 RepID=A0A1G4AT46_9PEZI|nr:uncharacterized protein CORC01_12335 [Colletotrichum orchidophilum]OHE92340.1 hypothetical protein CORC01_12335 [Colletotrichum orchidophilum]
MTPSPAVSTTTLLCCFTATSPTMRPPRDVHHVRRSKFCMRFVRWLRYTGRSSPNPDAKSPLQYEYPSRAEQCPDMPDRESKMMANAATRVNPLSSKITPIRL